MGSRYYYQQRRQRLGPVSSRELRRMARVGILRPGDLVQREGSSSWRPACEIAGLEFVVPGNNDAPSTASTGVYRRSRIHSWLGIAGSLMFAAFILAVAVMWLSTVQQTQQPLASAPELPAKAGLAPIRLEADVRPASGEARPPEPSDAPTAQDQNPSNGRAGSETAVNLPPPIVTPEDLIARVRSSVVRITARNEQSVSVGSAFVVNERGWLATNLHVVESCDEATAEFADGSRLNIIGFIAADPGVDLALVAIDAPESPLVKLAIAKSDPALASPVVACGFPRGLPFTVRNGVVEGVYRATDIVTNGVPFFDLARPDSKWIAVSNDLMHGNSGGPLVNPHGEVVGTVTLLAPIPLLDAHAEMAVLRFASAASELERLLDTADGRIQPLDRLPAFRKPTPPVQQGLPPQPVRDVARRLAQLKLIHEQRHVLLRQREESRGRLLVIQSQVVSANTMLTQRQGELSAITQAITELNVQLAMLTQRRSFTFEPQAAAALDAAIERRNADLLKLSLSHGLALAAAEAAAADLQGRQTQLAQEMRAHELLYAQAWQLRNEWLSLMDAFGALPPGDHQAALPTLSEWAVLDGESALPFLARAFAHFHLGDLGNAVADVEHAAILEEGDPFVISTMGWMRARMGNESQALRDIAAAFRLDRDCPYAYYCRAMVRLMAKNYSATERDLKHALRSAPDFAEAHIELARLKATCPADRMRNAKVALEHAERSLALTNRQDWRCHEVLAAAHAEAGQFEKAMHHIEQAIALTADGLQARCQKHKAQLEQKKPLRG